MKNTIIAVHCRDIDFHSKRREKKRRVDTPCVGNWLLEYVTQFYTRTGADFHPRFAKHAYLEQTEPGQRAGLVFSLLAPLLSFLIREPRFAFKHVVCLIYASQRRWIQRVKGWSR